jgi:hypothetical protein
MRKLIVPAVFFSVFLIHCDKGTGPQPPQCGPISDPSKQIEIISPVENEQITIGQTVKIKWKVDTRLGKVNIKILSEDGFFMEDILSTMLIPSGEDVVCMDTSWDAGRISENKAIEKDTTILLMVHKYGEESVNDFIPIRLKK